MRVLLDTHIALWAVTNDARLPKAAREWIENGDNIIFISAASLWEIAIKFALRRGRPDDMPISAAEARIVFDGSGFAALPITADHAERVAQLPRLHADPFDRMLAAQALQEPMPLITADPRVAAYGQPVVLV
jgi:PIN domain nuclease of toxin-antitoxin system